MVQSFCFKNSLYSESSVLWTNLWVSSGSKGDIFWRVTWGENTEKEYKVNCDKLLCLQGSEKRAVFTLEDIRETSGDEARRLRALCVWHFEMFSEEHISQTIKWSSGVLGAEGGGGSFSWWLPPSSPWHPHPRSSLVPSKQLILAGWTYNSLGGRGKSPSKWGGGQTTRDREEEEGAWDRRGKVRKSSYVALPNIEWPDLCSWL